MLKKTLVFIVVLMMVMSACVSCKTESADTDTTTETTEETTVSTDTTTETQEETTEEETSTSLLPYTGETVTLTAFAADLGMADDPDSAVYQIYKEYIGNIEIEWELAAWSDYYTKAAIYLNSGDIPDIIWYTCASVLADYADPGLLLDFNEYRDYTPNYNAIAENNPGLTLYETVDGQNFSLPAITPDMPAETWFANMTVLNRYGITEVPTTLEELEADMAIVAAADDGVVPFHTDWGLDYIMGIFGNTIEAKKDWYYDEDAGEWKHFLTGDNSNYKELIAMLADYYQKGYFAAEFATLSSEQTVSIMATGEWAFTFMYKGVIYSWFGKSATEDLDFDIVPFVPIAAEGYTPNVWAAYASDNPSWGYSVSAACEYPELAVSWCDACLSEEISTAFFWGVEGVSYTLDENGDEQWIQSFLDTDGAKAELGIYNILATRYVNKQDLRADLVVDSALDQEAITLLVDAIEAGELEINNYTRATPKFTDEESEELSSILTPINTAIDEAEAQFILGIRDMSEWDDFVAEVLAMGDLDRAVEIYNNAVQGPDRAQESDRTYTKP